MNDQNNNKFVLQVGKTAFTAGAIATLLSPLNIFKTRTQLQGTVQQ